MFRFCQFDFPIAPGPADGRYLVRGADGEQLAVVGVKTLGAKPRPLLGMRGRSRRAAKADGEAEAESIAITRLTVIAAEPFETEQDATGWLGSVRNRAAADDEIEDALKLANRVVYAHRLASRDPYEHEIARAGAFRIRIGFGTGDQVAEGEWTDARVVPSGADNAPRRPALDPEPITAELLSGRRPAHPGEELLLRARLDLDQGRTEQAAFQLRAATEAFVTETDPPPDASSWKQRAAELAPSGSEQLEQLATEMERTVRRRMHSG